jgi:hypothetical protein
VAARAGHEQVSAAGLLDQNRSGRPLVHATLDRDTVLVGGGLAQGLIELRGRALAKVLEVPTGRGKQPLETGSADIAELPRVDDTQGRPP